MNTETTQLNEENKNLQLHVDMKNKLERLYSNQDFIDVFVEEYFKNYAAHLVQIRVSPQLEERVIKGIDNDMTGIGAVQSFLHRVLAEGFSSETQLKENRATQNEIYAEDEERVA